MQRIATPAGLALLLACAAPALAQNPAPAGAQQGTFILRQGEEPLFTERFTRTADRLETVLTAPNGQSATIIATLAPDATVPRIEVRQPAAEGSPGGSSAAEFRGDSVFLSQTMGDSTRTDRRGVPAGLVPFINPSVALMEQIVRRARALGGTGPVEVGIWVAAEGGQAGTATVTFAGNQATIGFGPVDVVLQLDAQNNVRGGGVPAQGLTIVRTDGAAPAP